MHGLESDRLKSNKKKKLELCDSNANIFKNRINILDESQSPLKKQSKCNNFNQTETKQLDQFEFKPTSVFNEFTRDYKRPNDVSKDHIKSLIKHELGDSNMHYSSSVGKYVNHSDINKDSLQSVKGSRFINDMSGINIITGLRKN